MHILLGIATVAVALADEYQLPFAGQRVLAVKYRPQRFAQDLRYDSRLARAVQKHFQRLTTHGLPLGKYLLPTSPRHGTLAVPASNKPFQSNDSGPTLKCGHPLSG